MVDGDRWLEVVEGWWMVIGGWRWLKDGGLEHFDERWLNKARWMRDRCHDNVTTSHGDLAGSLFRCDD